MEGPSLYLAKEQLAPFIGKKILKVEGNTKISKERLNKEKILDIFSWGKHLVFQFETFALRVHFMLYGTFEATIRNKKVTGDYLKKASPIRLGLQFSMGHIEMFNCSLRFLENAHALDLYDTTIDVMSKDWDSSQAFFKCRETPNREICDVLLDQTIFSGVGNIIKNEVLFLMKSLPQKKISQFSDAQLRRLIKTTLSFSHQFYEWRKVFELRKHYQVYRQSKCRKCGEKIQRTRTGQSLRISFFCPHCQS